MQCPSQGKRLNTGLRGKRGFRKRVFFSVLRLVFFTTLEPDNDGGGVLGSAGKKCVLRQCL